VSTARLAREVKRLRARALAQNVQAQIPADRVEFARHIGARLHRHKLLLDPWQERVLKSNARQKILNTSRQVGKSTVVAALMLHKAMFTPESLSLIFAPTERQAKEVFAKVSRFYLAAAGALTPAAVRRMGLNLDNGSRIKAMPATETTVRGFTADLVVIDEAAYTKDAFYESILPSLAISEGELVLASTPHGERGFFYYEWEQGEDWVRYEVPATECPRIQPEFLEQERRRRSERYFLQEYMCKFMPTKGQVFSRELVQGARQRGEGIEPLFKEGELIREVDKGMDWEREADLRWLKIFSDTL
jgi:hypothetical protein